MLIGTLTIFLAAAIAAGACGLALSSRRVPKSVALLLTVAALAVVVLRASGYVPVAERPDLSMERPLLEPRDGYVTSDTCRACHPSQYASWHGSYHRTMTQTASPEAIVADFDGVELEVVGERFRLERDGDEFWVEMDRGDGTPVERRQIVMTTGSHHRQWVWFALDEERRVGAIPFIYLIDQQRWIPRPAAFLLPPDARWEPSRHEGLWGVGCISCHATQGERRNPDNPDARVAEFGIACEACHGGAEEHVLINRDPQRRYRLYLDDGEDSSIVNPTKLEHPRDSEVCGQCHSIHAAQGAFRPGDDLAAVTAGEQRKDPLPEASRWPDGMIHTGGREYDALIDTPCFRRGKMSCFSCHSMHRTPDDLRPFEEWANDQITPGMETNEGCVQCHEGLETESHTHHAPGSSGSNCYNCHMPYTSYALLKAIRNHQVDPPTVAVSIETGRPNACNLCHLDRSYGWTADHLEQWYGTPRPTTMTDDQRTVAAGVLLATTGHAGQRALIGWHMGWEPAREASGTGWMVPYLTLLINDPYPAVRIIAHRALRDLEGFETFEFDDVGPEDEREAAVRSAVEIWRTRLSGRSETGDPVLIDPDGTLQQERFIRLVGERDNRPVYWIE